MDLASESGSDGGLAIFVANRRSIAASWQRTTGRVRALFGLLRDLLKARSAPFSFLDLASGEARLLGWSFVERM